MVLLPAKSVEEWPVYYEGDALVSYAQYLDHIALLINCMESAISVCEFRVLTLFSLCLGMVKHIKVVGKAKIVTMQGISDVI